MSSFRTATLAMAVTCFPALVRLQILCCLVAEALDHRWMIQRWASNVGRMAGVLRSVSTGGEAVDLNADQYLASTYFRPLILLDS